MLYINILINKYIIIRHSWNIIKTIMVVKDES